MPSALAHCRQFEMPHFVPLAHQLLPRQQRQEKEGNKNLQQTLKPIFHSPFNFSNNEKTLISPNGHPYQGSTVDYYNTWEDMDKDESKAWQAVYPGMSEDRIAKKIEATRSIYKTEVRRLVDFVE